MNAPGVRRVNNRVVLLGSITLALIAVWAFRHLYNLSNINHKLTGYQLIFTLGFLFLSWSSIMAFFEKPKTTTPEQDYQLARLNVAVSVPLYNEDLKLLKNCLLSLLNQSRRPQTIVVVDDGSNIGDYETSRLIYTRLCNKYGVYLIWARTANGGKRHAQAVAVGATPEADIYITVDSDGILDYHAIAEGLKPFTDPKVFSVAGIVMAINARQNLLTRFTDLWFVTSQLVDRSSASALNSVLVNSGVLAFYRADLLRKYKDAYLNEEFFGRHVKFSDDSMLTLYALIEGKAIQQPTAFVFTAMPYKLNHHLRQYTRWMRGAFIRSWWRFKYLPLGGYAYWSHFFRWYQMVLITLVYFSFILDGSYFSLRALPYLLAIPMLIGYGVSLRYLTIKRTDISLRQQLAIYLLAPVAVIWGMSVLRVVRYYAIATCLKLGWGTRSKVEVGI